MGNPFSSSARSIDRWWIVFDCEPEYRESCVYAGLSVEHQNPAVPDGRRGGSIHRARNLLDGGVRSVRKEAEDAPARGDAAGLSVAEVVAHGRQNVSPRAFDPAMPSNLPDRPAPAALDRSASTVLATFVMVIIWIGLSLTM